MYEDYVLHQDQEVIALKYQVLNRVKNEISCLLLSWSVVDVDDVENRGWKEGDKAEKRRQRWKEGDKAEKKATRLKRRHFELKYIETNVS